MQVATRRWGPVSGWDEPLPDWDGPSTAVLVFAGARVEVPDPALAQVAAAFPTSAVLGCSTAGAVVDDLLEDDAVVVTVVRFAATRLRLRTRPVTASTSAATGADLGRALADDGLAAVLVVSEGLDVNGTALAAGLVDGLAERLGAAAAADVPVTGGLAGDGDRFGRTWVLVDGRPVPGHVSALGLYGARLRVGWGSQGGWSVFGPERRVTAAHGNVVHEFDDQPALALYRRYLGDRAGELPAGALRFPLAVTRPGSSDREVVRTVLAVDEDAQTMTFAGDVPTGSRVRLMRASVDRLLDGAEGAAEDAALTAGPTPSAAPALAVAVSCVGRRLVLGDDVDRELEAVRVGLTGDTVLAGFYSYGELAPVEGGPCRLHNQTMTMTTWQELPDDGRR
ncbi:FIST signal transduction protein [Lapillicoccus jejuensis]|uniref:FIST-like protein n=1 Tax=Lapillicoccus jejuensis TaxID=402171 RepID=A0A542E549_9MICO|nr:FIST N-terminal domain-containing protein [Lapillicoccus jejuensis]TQJ10470.1 hypothetical protein FB458_3593 [Lapillicoccus jejuensis]